MENVYIGCSGYSYDHWKNGVFYPEGTKDLFRYYQTIFPCLELNNTHYSFPKEHIVLKWYTNSPANYMFVPKAHRFITHRKMLLDPRPTIDFITVVANFKEKLGPILFQTPERLKPNPERLDQFLTALPVGYRYAFEFRNTGWLTTEVYQILKKHRATFVIWDFDHFHCPDVITSRLIYVRLHGPKSAYRTVYTQTYQEQLARKVQNWATRGYIVHVYYDNDYKGYAPRNALELKKLVG